MNIPDFKNTEVAFSSYSDRSLRKTAKIFHLMNVQWLVSLSSSLGLLALKLRIPLVKPIIRATIFDQFCGGESLEEAKPTIAELAKYKIKSVMDYGAEGKTSIADFDYSYHEIMNAIQFSKDEDDVPIVSLKITGLAPFNLLEKLQSGTALSQEENKIFSTLKDRLFEIGALAQEKGVGIFVDAEESWIQDAIDDLARRIQMVYNREKVIIYNTYQMYRYDRLEYLKVSHNHALKNEYLLGAKLVRGAYMDKERSRAAEHGYQSPIQVDKEATDRDYNEAISYCVENVESIASFNASHNVDSNMLQVQLMEQKNVKINHPHLNFCQLYGMSDNLTYNIAYKGFNAMKYLPYGKIKDVIPYLIRRAQENTSISSEMGRESLLINKELRRRESVK